MAVVELLVLLLLFEALFECFRGTNRPRCIVRKHRLLLLLLLLLIRLMMQRRNR